MKKLFKLVIILGFTGCCLSATFFFSTKLYPTTKAYEKQLRNHKDFQIRSETYYSVTSFGFENLRADALFLEMVQYMGENAFKEPLYHTDQYAERVTSLDPHFIFPYKLAGLVLPEAGKLDTAISILETGFQENPENWEIPYYLGYLYMMQKEDFEKAAYYFDIATTKENVLGSAPILASLAHRKQGGFEAGIALWTDVYNNASSEEEKEKARLQIEELESIAYQTFLIRDYISKNNIDSSDIDEDFLRTNHIIEQLPPVSYPKEYYWNSSKNIIDTKISHN